MALTQSGRCLVGRRGHDGSRQSRPRRMPRTPRTTIAATGRPPPSLGPAVLYETAGGSRRPPAGRVTFTLRMAPPARKTPTSNVDVVRTPLEASRGDLAAVDH